VKSYEKGVWLARPKMKKTRRWCKGSTQEIGDHWAYICPAQKAVDKIEAEHQAILFLYKAYKTKYRRIIKQMENDILQRKDPCPNTVCWCMYYSDRMEELTRNRDPKTTEANDGVVFTIIWKGKEGQYEKWGDKRKSVINSMNVARMTLWRHPTRKDPSSKYANILSLYNVHYVTHDSFLNTGYVVHNAHGTNHVFIPSKKSLFFSRETWRAMWLYGSILMASRIFCPYAMYRKI